MRHGGSAAAVFLIVVLVAAAGIVLASWGRRHASSPQLASDSRLRHEDEQNRSMDGAGAGADADAGASTGAEVAAQVAVDVYRDVLDELGAADRNHVERVILALAKRFTECSVRGESLPALESIIGAPDVPSSVSSILRRRSAGVFITVIRNNAVRACIGSIWPHYPNLAQEIAHFAAAVAARDLRRPPIEPRELSGCTYAVSVVGRLERVSPGTAWDPRSYGVFVRAGERSGVILPGEALTYAKQVSWALSEAGIDARMPYEMYRFQTAKFGGSLNLRGGLGQ